MYPFLSLCGRRVASGAVALLLAVLLLAPPATAQTYNAGLVYTGLEDLVYEAGGIYNDVGGEWTNQGRIVHDGPAVATFVNHGTYLATANGLDQFTSATSAIELAGTAAPTFYDVAFENTGPVNLTNTDGALVTNTATLSNTLVNNVAVGVAGALRFGAAGSYTWTTGPDDVHHVNGYVGKFGPNQFTYPVGSGTDYRYVRAAAPNGLTLAFLASNPQGTASFAPTLAKVFPSATWPVAAVPASTAVTVSIPMIGPDFAVAAKLRLVGWDGTQWIDLSGSPTATGVAEGSELSGTLTAGIQALGIGAAVDPLPVTLYVFAVRAVKTDAVLNWATASEKNSAYFQVERSPDGHAAFEAVGAPVPAAGTTAAAHTYTQTDANVGHAGGTFYYRLRQVDADGKFTLSNVLAVRFGAPAAWAVEVWPNPVRESARLAITTAAAGPATVQLFDLTGRLVSQHTVAVAAGTTTVALPQAAALPPGIYVLRVSQGAAQTSIRLVRD